jgi:hypothetical protein
MKIGDLVKLRSGFGHQGAGIIIDTYWNNANGTYSEMRVKWLSERKDSTWFMTRDLETLSENR